MSEAGGQALPPTHHRKRRTAREPPRNKANVWPHVHELTAAYHDAHSDVPVKDRNTHVCIEEGCWQLMKLHCHKKQGGNVVWINSVAARHLVKTHPELPVSKMLIKSASKVHDNKITTSFLVGAQMAGQKRSKKDEGDDEKPAPKKQCTAQTGLDFKIDPQARAVCSQALCYAYGRCVFFSISFFLPDIAVAYVFLRHHLSKSTFAERAFRFMMKCQFEAGIAAAGKKNPTPPIISAGGLRAWVVAEYEVFLLFAQYMMEISFEYSEGNAFAQVQHDGVTLADRNKYFSIELSQQDHLQRQQQLALT